MVHEHELRQSVDRLTVDGYVFLDERCGGDLVAGILDVARQEARNVQGALGTREIGIGSAALAA